MEACSITSRASLESSTKSFVLCLAVRLMSPCMESGEQGNYRNKICYGHSPNQLVLCTCSLVTELLLQLFGCVMYSSPKTGEKPGNGTSAMNGCCMTSL